MALVKRLQAEKDDQLETIQKQKEFIAKLEEDLCCINNLSLLYRGEGEGQADAAILTSEIVAEVSRKQLIDYSPEFSGDISGAAETLLPIISRQRERFRQQNQELEIGNASLRRQLATVQNDVERLRADNIKLYEKIRFLQSYAAKQSKQSDEMDTRYSKEYEEKLNPFSTFSRKERRRKYMNLSPFEKVTLTMGKVIMSNRTARTITVLYTVFLHCLIFLVLYKLAYTESCKRDLAAECKARFAEHMENVHGEII